MIDITPATDSDTEVQRGDKVRVSWLLNASVDPAHLTLTVTPVGGSDTTYSGSDLQEKEVEKDGERFWRYYKDLVLPSVQTEVEWTLDDPVNGARDTAKITAQI